MKKLNGLKIAILVANGFEQVEMVKPRHALEEAGAQTFLISPEKEKVQGWNHMEKADLFPIDCSLNDANSNDYDALLLPGGVINPDHLRILPKAVAFVKEMRQQNKPVAAICHGPWLLINGGGVKGCKVTSWSSVSTDLINAGAQWIDASVVCDDKIVTSRNPDDIPQFNEAMIKLFQAH